MKRRTKIIIKPTTVIKFPVKRLKMIKRRINNLLEERYSWDARNKQLSDKLGDVKLANALLQKEIVEYRNRYREAINSINSFKIIEQDMRRTIEGYHFDDNPHPHLAALDQGITNGKLIIDLLNTFLSLGDQNDALFRQICHLPISLYNQNKLTEPVGRVVPRVKGILESIPQIMLPHSNYQDSDSQETSHDTQKQNISLTSNQEEQWQDNKIPSMPCISFRKNKSKLGGKKSARGDKPTKDIHDSLIPSDSSHITVRKSSPINRMENVVRLSHASQLMRNSLFQLNSVPLENMENSNFLNNLKETEVTLFRNSHGQIPADDPLEGCSSRSGEQNYRSSITKSRYTRVFLQSDSSDDDLDCLPVQNHRTLCTSTLANPLLDSSVNSMNNRTYVVSKGSASNSLNDDAFNSSPNAEPDSTSLPNLRDDASQFYVSPTVDEFTNSNGISAKNRFLDGNSQRQQKKKNNAHNQFLHVNEAKSFEESGKRHRKPKNLSYPGEEDISLKKEMESGKLSVGRKAAHRKLLVRRNSLGKQNVYLHKKTTVTRANVTGPKSSNNKSSVPLKLRNSTTHSKRSSSRSSQVITLRNSESNTNSNESIRDINGVVHHHSMPVVEGFPIDRTVQNRGNSESPVRSEKRKRKPKKHTIPGDEDTSPKKLKVSSARFSIGKISTHGKLSIGRKSFSKEQKSLKKHVRTVTAANLKGPRSSNTTSSKPFKQSLNNLVQEHSKQQKKRKPSSKQRSKSHTTPRNSECNINCNESDKEIEDSRVRSLRNRSNISYKESPPRVEKNHKEIEDSRVRSLRNRSNISYKESPPRVEKKNSLKKNKNPQ